MAHRGRIALVLTALAALTLTTGVADAAAPKPPPTVNVSVTKTRVVHVPGTIRPGLHRFHVTSATVSNFEIAKPKAGYTKAEFAHDYNKGGLAMLKRIERHVSLRGGTFTDKDQPATAYVDLAAGSYWVFDQAAASLRTTKVKSLTVTGQRVTATVPSTTGTLRATKANRWEPAPGSINHSGVVRLRNGTGQPFELVLSKLKAGKTFADFKAWIAAGAPDDASYPLDDSHQLVTGALSPGQTYLHRYALPAGDYVVLSIWPALDGSSQLAHGMFREITLK